MEFLTLAFSRLRGQGRMIGSMYVDRMEEEKIPKTPPW